MSTINQWRDIANDQLKHIIPQDIFRKCIEISIYNWSVHESKKVQWFHLSSEQKYRLLHFYRKKMRSIIFNLKENKDFFNRVIQKQFDFKGLPYMSPEEINPTLWVPVVKTVALKKMQKYTHVEKQHHKGKFKCAKCFEENTVFIEMQTRSEENITTTHVLCKSCNFSSLH
jgi:DNA-directed RNA polymerase subunit M/transcription elongation factor TFIIS